LCQVSLTEKMCAALRWVQEDAADAEAVHDAQAVATADGAAGAELAMDCEAPDGQICPRTWQVEALMVPWRACACQGLVSEIASQTMNQTIVVLTFEYAIEPSQLLVYARLGLI